MLFTVQCDMCGETGTDCRSARFWAERHVAEKHTPEIELVDMGRFDPAAVPQEASHAALVKDEQAVADMARLQLHHRDSGVLARTRTMGSEGLR